MWGPKCWEGKRMKTKSILVIGLGLSLAGGLLAGCGQSAGDQFGIYADGPNFIAVNHVTSRINYASDGSAPDVLLAATQKGGGIGFTTWRDKSSCGMTDSSGNVFAVPRSGRFDKDNAFFTVDADKPVFGEVNGGPVGSLIITLRSNNLVRVKYLYDDAVGIRWIDQYDPNGEFDRRIWLERGTGFLAHCRGFSAEDYK